MKRLRNTTLVLVCAIILALLLPSSWAETMKRFIYPALFLMMTLSLSNVVTPKLKITETRFLLLIITINFLIMPMVVIFVSHFFQLIPSYHVGLSMWAIMPPAAAVIPISLLVHANTKRTIEAEFTLYALALIVTPLLVLLLFGARIDIWNLVQVLLGLIVVPFILSRVIRYSKIHYSFNYDFKEVVNLLFAFGIYIGIAVSKDTVLGNPGSLLKVLVVLIIVQFVFGTLFYFISKRLGAGERDALVYFLFSTHKNGNLALAFCLWLFSPQTAVPLAIRAILHPLLILYIKWIHKV